MALSKAEREQFLAGPRKARLIESAGCFSLMVGQVSPTLRYVSVDGDVSRVEPGTDDHHIELARRYLPPERADQYLKFALGLGEQVVIYLRPGHWVSADLAAV